MPDDDILSIQNVSFDCIVIGKQRDYTNYAIPIIIYASCSLFLFFFKFIFHTRVHTLTSSSCSSKTVIFKYAPHENLLQTGESASISWMSNLQLQSQLKEASPCVLRKQRHVDLNNL